MPHVEKEMPTLLEHLSSSPVFIGIQVARSLVFYAICGRSLLTFGPFLAIVLPVLRIMASDYPFGKSCSFLANLKTMQSNTHIK